VILPWRWAPIAATPSINSAEILRFAITIPEYYARALEARNKLAQGEASECEAGTLGKPDRQMSPGRGTQAVFRLAQLHLKALWLGPALSPCRYDRPKKCMRRVSQETSQNGSPDYDR
jgi:hypothetical protein